MNVRTRLGRRALILVFGLQACSGPAPTPGTSTIEITPPPTQPGASEPVISEPPDPLASPSLTGSFVVDDSGRKLAISCWGSGSPTVFFESGGAALEEFRNTPLVRRVASETRACLANRAGRPPSDAAPNRAREAEDVAADFQALVDAAAIAPPYVLFGRSFGGMVVTFYASEYPENVAGVVVFDSPAPSADFTIEEFPEGVWDYPGNVERLNVLTGYETRFAKEPVHFDAPLILISTTAGESRPEDRYWLQTSPDSRQVVLQGGMEVIDARAEAIAQEILTLVNTTPGAGLNAGPG